MSGIINKIKDAVSSDKTHDPAHGTHNAGVAGTGAHGTHSTGTHATGTHGTTGLPGTHNTTGAGIGGTHGTHTTGTHGTTGLPGTHNTTGAGIGGAHTHNTAAGPHSSDLANKVDPRVDSDRDGRGIGQGHAGTTGTQVGGTSHTGAHTGVGGVGGVGGTHAGTHTGAHTGVGGVGGTHGSSGLTGNTGYGSNTAAGPHSSNMANKVDPRVDSDRDGRGIGQGHAGTTGTQVGGTSHTGAHTGVGGVGGTHAGTHTGAHTGVGGVGGTHTGTHTGAHTGVGGTGVGGTHAGTHGVGGVAGSGPGPAPNTAGPHKSDMLNKMDPRVDSNLDGSKTVGGNKTYQAGAGSTAGYHKDPTDAAQVPPSVLQQTVGVPEVTHGDHEHDRMRRNSTATHQETHRGV